MNLYRHLVTAGAVGALALGSACADQATSPDGPGIEINIAPVTYNAATNICYGIAVENAADDTVVYLPGICSGQYGNGAGGDIAYVAPCDASGGGSSTVTLWLEEIRIADTDAGAVDGHADYDIEDPDSYINPCGFDASKLDIDFDNDGDDDVTADTNSDDFVCQKTNVICKENEDVQVAFNLTVMRSAQQGFFDIIVDFEDIFCSAKLDTCYVDADGAPPGVGAPIQLLLDGDGTRDDTAVIALACSTGADATGDLVSTKLHMTRIALTCDGNTYYLSPGTDGTHPAGNRTATTTGAETVRYALYTGDEALACDGLGGGSCNSSYWNLAINLEDLEEGTLSNCTVSFDATATGDGLTIANGNQFMDGTTAAVGVTYPGIHFTEQILAGGASTCDYNPLNGPNSDIGATSSGVTTVYYSQSTVPVFCFEKAQGGLPANIGTGAAGNAACTDTF